MICQRCGRDNPLNVAYCQGCGSTLATDYAQTYDQQQVFEPTNYGGIGARFVAALIDGILIGIPIGIISTTLGVMMTVRVIDRSNRDSSFNPGMAADAIGTFFAGFGLIMLISLLITWAYFAMMESSGWQGTPGKRIMGLKVTDLQGNRISLAKATIRLVVKAFLSGWFLLGYIMAFFTRRKQGLHDMIAGTLVLTRDPLVYSSQTGYPQQQNPSYPMPPQICPYCNNILSPGSRFCSHCGRSQ